MYFLKQCTLLLYNMFLGYFKSSSNLLIIPAFNILNSIFKMKDDPPESTRKAEFLKLKECVWFLSRTLWMWISQAWGRLTGNAVWGEGIWEAGRADTWPFEVLGGIEVKETPGGLQNHLTFSVSDGPNQKKSVKIKFHSTSLLKIFI